MAFSLEAAIVIPLSLTLLVYTSCKMFFEVESVVKMKNALEQIQSEQIKQSELFKYEQSSAENTLFVLSSPQKLLEQIEEMYVEE